MRPRVLVLYEYGVDASPHSSAYLRLLRPLSHPSLQTAVHVYPSPIYTGQEVELVIVDRLWRPDISLVMAESLIDDVRRSGAKLVYALDDNLLDLPAERIDWPTPTHLEIVRLFLRQADALLVTTPFLAERYAAFNDHIFVIGNALDERLLLENSSRDGIPLFGPRPLTIGYMGTLTHDQDLLVILPALEEIGQRYDDRIRLQVVGGIGAPETAQRLARLPVPTQFLQAEEVEYPQFMLWFTGRLAWDIGLAPLRDTPFNRGKSDIKFLDYSALGAAGIYSDMPVYAGSVRHGENGWLAANRPEAWVDALETLIADPDLRMAIATKARRYLYQERVLRRRANDWLATLETIWYG